MILNHLLWRLFHLEIKSRNLSEEIESRSNALEKHKLVQSKFENELKEAKKEQARLHKENIKLEKSIAKKNKELESRHPDLVKIEEQVSHAEKKLKLHTDSREKSKKELERQESDLSDLESQLKTVEKASKRFEENTKRNERKNGITLSADQLDEYTKLREKANAQASSEMQDLEELKRQLEFDDQEKSRLSGQLEEIDQRMSSLKQEKTAHNDSKEKALKQISQLESELQNTKREISTASTERQKLDQNEKETEERLSEVYAKLTQARYDKKESERSRKFRDAIDTMRRIFPGVKGRFVDLCKPMQKKYETAVSIVLGKNIDAIIVDYDQTAIDCIQYLKEQQIGLATFIPLESIQAKPVHEKYRSMGKGSRLAIDVIEFDKSLSRAFAYACGNTMICDNLAIAKDLCFGKGESVKAVTIDGTVIHKSGMMTGGKSDQLDSQSMKWEERELDDIRRLKKRFENQLKDISKTRRKLANEEQLKASILSIESRISASKDEVAVTETKLASIQKELDHLTSEKQQVAESQASTDSSLKNLKANMERVSKEISKVEDSIFSDFCARAGLGDIREYEGDRLKVAKDFNDKLVQFENQRSRLENEISYAKDQVVKINEKIEKLNQLSESDKTNLDDLKQKKSQFLSDNEKFVDEIKVRKQEFENSKKEEESKSEEVSISKNSLAGCNTELDKISKEISSREAEMEKYIAERYDIFRRCKLEEINLPLINGSIDDFPLDDTERESQEFDSSQMDIDHSAAVRMAESQKTVAAIEIDYDTLDEELKESGDAQVEANFQDRIKTISAEIERMAPNLKAIERLGGVETRFKETAEEFEQSRRQAKISREKFNAIKQKRYDLFYKAYSHVAQKIDQVYKELTRSRTHPLGGTAYLTLENNEEPYLDGVKYHAMPPMKRFRDMEQLSGGEKTVAALALLFAIHSYHPSPFFVLDEVDAALDNANVAKIANYIKKHASDDLQFIVISLKNSLYETSEALVGIYRDHESRSSKALTLDLTAYEE